MIYAPIIIPTCNRINHLKRCISSLQNNIWSADTEIYISVDYPPNDKYRDGYAQVLEYVRSGITGFRSVNVYEQKKNLGPTENNIFLINEVVQRYDRWIVTEDDNEFSPNYIEYMDRCLEKFASDEHIFAVCGSLESKTIHAPFSVYQSTYFQPYGCGFWKNKYDKFINEKDSILLSKNRYRFKSMYSLYKERAWIFRVYVEHILWNRNTVFWDNVGELNPVDGVVQLYLYYQSYRCVFPAVAKARTWGNDGSGFTMSKDLDIQPEKFWPLDESSSFELILPDDPLTINEILKKDEIKFKREHRTGILKLWIKYLLVYIDSRRQPILPEKYKC